MEASVFSPNEQHRQIVSDLMGVDGHQIVFKPWGGYRVLAELPTCTIKLLVILPMKRLSLQKHMLRAELWKVIKGQLYESCTRRTVYQGGEYRITDKAKHRLCNKREVPVLFVEIQSGVCREDDIIRYEDDFGRCDNLELTPESDSKG